MREVQGGGSRGNRPPSWVISRTQAARMSRKYLEKTIFFCNLPNRQCQEVLVIGLRLAGPSYGDLEPIRQLLIYATLCPHPRSLQTCCISLLINPRVFCHQLPRFRLSLGAANSGDRRHLQRATRSKPCFSFSHSLLALLPISPSYPPSSGPVSCRCWVPRTERHEPRRRSCWHNWLPVVTRVA